jgi:hypothetical protein
VFFYLICETGKLLLFLKMNKNMKFKYKGYTGKYLRVDLSSGKIKAEELNPEFAENYLGGEGFGIKILWDEVPPSVDPLSPENKIIFATGPLNGSFWPNAGRLEAVSKSPLTGIFTAILIAAASLLRNLNMPDSIIL